MAREYDIIVVGAGPAGLCAARAAAENGMRVAILEKKPDPAKLTRACAQTLISMNESFFGDICIFNPDNNRISFPHTGFSVTYSGPHKNLYAQHAYTPGGHLIEIGNVREQRMKGDLGRVGLILDKETLFRGMLEEARACGVDIISGVNVDAVIPTEDSVTAGDGGKTFKGRYLIAADGVNSKTAEILGFNKDRQYYCNMYSIAWDMTGMKLPEPDVVYTIQGFHEGCGVMLFALAEAKDDLWMLIMLTVDPRANLNKAAEAFMKKPFCAEWFRNTKSVGVRSAVCNCWSPIVEPFRNNVLVVGDAASTQEIENTAAMISGWKAGKAAAASIQEERLGIEITGVNDYVNWWKQIYTPLKSEIYMKIYAPPYFLTSDKDMDYVLGPN
ncbi:MAG: FAD-dependent oxidoreductase [Chloroflexota bacterium]